MMWQHDRVHSEDLLSGVILPPLPTDAPEWNGCTHIKWIHPRMN